MRLSNWLKFILLATGLMWCPSAWATLTCTDGAAACTSTTAHNCTTASTSCTITFTTTAGRGLVLAFQTGLNTVTFSSTSDGGFTCPAGSRGTGTAGAAQACYVLSSGGVASIVCTFSASNSFNQCELTQYSHTLSPLVFDTSNHGDNSGCTVTPANCPGVSLALGTANNYLLIQSNNDSGTSSAIDQSYSIGTLNGSAFAYKVNVSAAGTTPNWTSTNPSHDMNTSGLAIYETPAASAVKAPPWYKLPTAGPSFAISILIGLLIGIGYSAVGRRNGIPEASVVYRVRSLAGNHSRPTQPALGTPVIEMRLDCHGTQPANLAQALTSDSPSERKVT